jgi:endoglucanase
MLNNSNPMYRMKSAPMSSSSFTPVSRYAPTGLPPCTRRKFLLTTSALVAVSTSAIALETRSRGEKLPCMTGVAIAGAEFGTESSSFSNRNPGSLGKDYTYPSQTTIAALADRGVRLFRIPVRWERLQPNLDGPLLQLELKNVDALLRTVATYGCRAIIDLHNYGRYQLYTPAGPKSLRIDEVVHGTTPVASEHFAAFWRDLAARYAGHAGVQGYGIMNEPHSMGDSNWKQISQKAVDGIRQVDKDSWIFVAGNDWSSAERFKTANGNEAWIRDPSFRTAYEAHCYFDRDGSGKYKKSFNQELQLDPNLLRRPLMRLENFASWCERNRVSGFLGEFGVPASDPNWNPILEQFMIELRKREISASMWAAGDWWGEYPLSLQPRGRASDDSLALKLLRQYC